MAKLTQQELERHLWGAADILRGTVDAGDYKQYIFGLLFYILSLIRESFIGGPPEHFAIVRPPQETDYSNKDEYHARMAQHVLWTKDLTRYGLTP